jgi:hypothetical protein
MQDHLSDFHLQLGSFVYKQGFDYMNTGLILSILDLFFVYLISLGILQEVSYFEHLIFVCLESCCRKIHLLLDVYSLQYLAGCNFH